MKEMERKSNKLILLMLLLPLAVVLIAAGCKKKEGELYQFVITSVTKSESVTDSESMSSETSEITMESESAVPTDTTAEETTEETTEETSEETTTKAEVKAETKKTTKATTKATAKAVKKTAKTTKKTTKTTTKKKKATPTPTPKPKYSGYLFVGDSRTVGLDEAVSGVSSIAKVGAGVTYFKSILPEVTKVRGKNVIFNFGVNDRDRYKDYVAVYKSLPKEFIQKNNVIFMSVNPTDGSKYGSWNADIDKFNAYVKKNLPSGIKYLNTNSTLKKEGFQTRDGCHYKPVTYKRIAQLTFIFCGDKNRKP